MAIGPHLTQVVHYRIKVWAQSTCKDTRLGKPFSGIQWAPHNWMVGGLLCSLSEFGDNVQCTVAAGVGVTRVEVTSDGKYLVALTDTVSPAV